MPRNVCYISWPDEKSPLSYWDASMSIGHGTFPSTCKILIPYSVSGIPNFGTLTWTDGDTSISLPDCRCDVIQGELSPRGRTWMITIFDRRWRWKYPKVQGWYNIRLGNLSIRPGTEMSPRQLAELLLREMGEEIYDTTEMPDDLRPEVRWDPPVLASEALNSLCETTGCRVVPWFHDGVFDGVRICRAGDGRSLPETNLEYDPGIEIADMPDRIRVGLAPTIWEVHLPLDPVISTDFFSEWNGDETDLWEDPHYTSILNEYPPQTFTPPPVGGFFNGQGEQYVIPGSPPPYNPESPPEPFNVWTKFPTVLRRQLQNEIDSWRWNPQPYTMPPALQPENSAYEYLTWTTQMQQKLQNEALRCYQIRLPFTIPGVGTVTRHSQYMLTSERAQEYQDRQSQIIQKAPAYVYGSWWLRDYGMNVESFYGVDDIEAPIDPENPITVATGFDIDAENRLVRFPTPMYRNGGYTDELYPPRLDPLTQQPIGMYVFGRPGPGGEAPPERVPIDIFFEPAALVLVTGIKLLVPDRSLSRYVRSRDLTPPEYWRHSRYWVTDTQTYEDYELHNVVSYAKCESDRYAWIESVDCESVNEEECEQNADYYLDYQDQRFQTKTPKRAKYLGFYPIDLDGAIFQVTYTSSKDDGAFTTACRDSEWAFETAVPYGQRRQIEELRQWRSYIDNMQRGQVGAFREFTFLPSGHGGVWGLTPPR